MKKENERVESGSDKVPQPTEIIFTTIVRKLYSLKRILEMFSFLKLILRNSIIKLNRYSRYRYLPIFSIPKSKYDKIHVHIPGDYSSYICFRLMDRLNCLV